jgi:hypothetical protein
MVNLGRVLDRCITLVEELQIDRHALRREEPQSLVGKGQAVPTITVTTIRDVIGDRPRFLRKGEKGAAIIFWKFLPARDRDGDAEPDAPFDDEQERKLIPFARSDTVFNVEQCEGLDVPPLVEEEAPDMGQGNKLAEQIRALPNLKHGSNFTRGSGCPWSRRR